MAPRLQFLRPCTSPVSAPRTVAQCSAYLHFYELAKAHVSRSPRSGARKYATDKTPPVRKWLKEEQLSPAQRSAKRSQRVDELQSADKLHYPGVNFVGKPTQVRDFCTQFQEATAAELETYKNDWHAVNGRVLRVRRHGRKLGFVDIIYDGCVLQIMVNFAELMDETTEYQLKVFYQLLQRGDYISVTGHPVMSDTNKLSLLAKHLPKTTSPCLVPLPHKMSPELGMQNRHMDLIVSRGPREILVLREQLINHLRAHLRKVLKCVEVQTPILAASAGGAAARPFTTRASEFSQKELALRIAPELWLKRLVVGGMDRVFEIGTSFRNEGLDATHNPEFTTCEFYIAGANLNALINMTHTILYGIAQNIEHYRERSFSSLSIPDLAPLQSRYESVEFIPAIEEALGDSLPNLDSDTALPDLIALLEKNGKTWHHSLPSMPSLPKLLDHIAAAVIEPQSQYKPLFIKYHPACMSPLSRSFTCPTTGQNVAARAELFYNGNELANMYEEENDPFKQRAKFVAQAKARNSHNINNNSNSEDPGHVIDEQYLAVLESGLPPTGGWGAGIDRLVMLFSGAERICDVLPFGNLRHVVGLASVGSGHGGALVQANRRVRKKGPDGGFLKEFEEDAEEESKMDGKVGDIVYRKESSKVIEDTGSEIKEIKWKWWEGFTYRK